MDFTFLVDEPFMVAGRNFQAVFLNLYKVSIQFQKIIEELYQNEIGTSIHF